MVDSVLDTFSSISPSLNVISFYKLSYKKSSYKLINLSLVDSNIYFISNETEFFFLTKTVAKYDTNLLQ